jgi:hypothetical protein
MSALTGLHEDEPEESTGADRRAWIDALGVAASELRWFAWHAGEPETGWRLHLAVEDPLERLAWTVAASDASA